MTTPTLEKAAAVIEKLERDGYRFLDDLSGYDESTLPTSNEWRNIETAPKDGSKCLLWCTWEWSTDGRVEIGSFRIDEGFSGDSEPQWLDESYDDFSTSYASNPLSPTHWMPLPPPPQKET